MNILEYNDELLNNLCNQIILTLEYTLHGLKDQAFRNLFIVSRIQNIYVI